MLDGEETRTFEGEPDPVANYSPQSFWSRPLVLVFVSIVLSSGISGSVVSFGWKASIDTINAVTSVKLADHEEQLHRLQTAESDRIKASDLAIRDQLLDAKLSLLQSEIADV